jgi:hypothetical protein
MRLINGVTSNRYFPIRNPTASPITRHPNETIEKQRTSRVVRIAWRDGLQIQSDTVWDVPAMKTIRHFLPPSKPARTEPRRL